MSAAVGRLFVKHCIAGAVVTAVVLGFTLISYVALLIWAVIAAGGIGSPAALPLMLLTGLAASVCCVLLLFLPVTVAAELICVRWMRWNRFTEVPVSIVLLLALLMGSTAASYYLVGWGTDAQVTIAAVLAAVLLVPLGIYWWTLQSADYLLTIGEGFVNRYRQRAKNRDEKRMAG